MLIEVGIEKSFYCLYDVAVWMMLTLSKANCSSQKYAKEIQLKEKKWWYVKATGIAAFSSIMVVWIQKMKAWHASTSISTFHIFICFCLRVLKDVSTMTFFHFILELPIFPVSFILVLFFLFFFSWHSVIYSLLHIISFLFNPMLNLVVFSFLYLTFSVNFLLTPMPSLLPSIF